MRLARFVLAAVLVVGVISTANAANFVWWEAVGNNADSTVVGQGMGQNLDLECHVIRSLSSFPSLRQRLTSS
ncbi:MAG: hypothetical protein ACE5EC_08380, partial [Phycisphaerae bacterium]